MGIVSGVCLPTARQEKHHGPHFMEKDARAQSGLSHSSKRHGAWSLTPEPAQVTAGHTASYHSQVLCLFLGAPGLTGVEVNSCPYAWDLLGSALRRSLGLFCNLLHPDHQS